MAGGTAPPAQPTPRTNTGGDGGAGKTSHFDSVARAGGGGGGRGGYASENGVGNDGGGDGGHPAGTAGAVNTGGGGGGALAYNGGGAGGSGIVMFTTPPAITTTFSPGVTHAVVPAGYGGELLKKVTATSDTSQTVTFS